MERVYNFSAGPGTLPLEVLEKAQKDLVNYESKGLSVMEMSHRSALYEDIQNEAKETLLDLLGVDDSYDLLFLGGGATTQFSAVPLNLMQGTGKADYLVTGSWSKKAFQEAQKYGGARLLASSEDKNFTYIPAFSKEDVRKDADYLHMCVNNTIYGTRIIPSKIPDLDLPMVADMSSNILSEYYDLSKFSLVYAGAQKNLGPAGVTLVLVKKDLLGKAHEKTPQIMDYKVHADKDSRFNTPPCFNIYMVGLVAKWLKALGGVEEMEKINKEKARLLYDTIDSSKVFKNPVKEEDRSLTNVIFLTENSDMDKAFIDEAGKNGLISLKGHRSVGGIRASIYNAMPLEGVKKLTDFMKEFDLAHK